MKRPTKVYLVWDVRDEGTENEYGYYEVYDSLEELAESQDGEIEIFEATPKSLGRFRIKSVAEKIEGKKQ